ncbi:maltase 1-like [Planococcus citri]|uniref:maltase 1-like n=1 Tax=Planococcus citri TaxID=170843 RepID=UPI0031F84BE9
MKIFLAVIFLFHMSQGALDSTWWKYTNLYEVFVPAFKDGNGDGMGDIKGLISKLDHFVELGIETVYLTPIYPSPMADSGYDITDFTAIHPSMGTMKDFDTLMRETKARGIKVVLDMVVNHSSDEHPWFIKSVNKTEPYTDYYIWKNPKGFDKKGKPIPPNNWLNQFDGTAWRWNKKRKQFYMHQFTSEQPDFNLRNPRVINEMKKIFNFWLRKGVAGFRLDAVKHLVEDDQFRDEPAISEKVDMYNTTNVNDLKHIYTHNLWESYQIVHELRMVCEKFVNRSADFERILITEDYVTGDMLYRYYDTKDYKIAQLPLNFILDYIDRYVNATVYDEMINEYLDGLPTGATPCWNSENHDKWRKALIFTEEYAFIFPTMTMLLPGVAYLYYGQEIGVTGSHIRSDLAVNKYADDFTQSSRDSYRLPMQWDDSLNSGFSNNRKTILPLTTNYWRINVKNQKQQKYSHYHMFKKMLKLRKTETIKHGDFKSYVISTWVFAFTRTLKGHESYVAIFNMGTDTEFVDLHNSIDSLPKSLVVEIASRNSGYKPGDKLSSSPKIPKILVLRPSATLVFSSDN